MNFILDVILIAVCVAVVVISTKRGFFRSLMSFVSTLIALFAAYTFTPLLSGFIKEKFILGPMTDKLTTTVSSNITAADGSIDYTGLADKMSTTLDKYNVSESKLQEFIDAVKGSAGDPARELSERIADSVATGISTAIAFILLFIVFAVLLHVATVVIDTVFKLPVLRTANTVLGFVFGLLTACVIVLVYTAGVSVLVSSLGSVSSDWFGEDKIDRTLIIKFFAERDFFGISDNLIS